MKKTWLILILSALLLVTCACGNDTPDTPDMQDGSDEDRVVDTVDTDDEANPPISGETDEPVADAAYTLEFEDGKAFRLGEVAGDAVSTLGEQLAYAEAPSCIHPGMDKIYTFDGFDLTTSPDAEGRDCIYEVAITSDAVAIKGGLTIGSSRDTMESTFGTDYTEQFGVVRYVLDEISVSVILDGDYVTSIVVTVNW